VELLAEAALRHGVPIDAHIDETLEPGSLAIEHLIALAHNGFPHRITASHAVSLASLPQQRQRELADRLAASGVGVVTLPSTNLYLQARGRPTAPPARHRPGKRPARRGRRGGGGRGQPARSVQRPSAAPIRWRRASLLVSAAHLRPVQALGMITSGARALLDLPAVAVTPGSPADLVAIRAESIEDAVGLRPGGAAGAARRPAGGANPHPDRLAGNPVARTRRPPGGDRMVALTHADRRKLAPVLR